jgi:nicotinamidase-related amidase
MESPLADNLHPYPLTSRTVHLCVDMQRLFSTDGPWPTPWMERVLPVIAALAGRHPERTVFTRFIPPERATDMPGMWQRYYHKWKGATREHLDPTLLELLPPLAELCPPAIVVDKSRYSAFTQPQLLELLQGRSADGLIVTGSETDVCVLATVLSAVDLGYRVIVAEDAICSSSDQGHDALMQIYCQRYSEQIEVADAATILDRWES